MTAADLAARLQVSIRTIQRDADALSAAGVPVYAQRGRAGGYRLATGYRSRLTALDRDEALALAAMGASEPARELGLGLALLSARLKIAAALPDPLRGVVGEAASRFHLDAPGWFTRHRPVPHLAALAQGVFGDVEVTARYRAKAGPRDCRLRPLGLVLKAGIWYLVAAEGTAVRGYRADRFELAEPTGEKFSRPDRFDLAAFWNSWRDEFERGLPVVQVSVRARPRCVAQLRRVVEPAYVSTVDWRCPAGADGWIRLDLPFEKLEYVPAALLGLGGDVEVLGPAALRGQMATAAAALGTLYGSPKAAADPQQTYRRAAATAASRRRFTPPAGSSLPNTAVPATNMSAPASAQRPIVSSSTPPST